MLISDRISQILLPAKPELQKLLQNLQPGQLLKATVLSQGQQGTVGLRLGALEVQAHTKLSFDVGQRLTLEVKKAGDMPELRLLRELSSSEVQTKTLRQVLPRQMPPTRLFEALSTLDRPASSNIKTALRTLMPKLPAEGKAALQTLLRTVPAEGKAALQTLARPILTLAEGREAIRTLEHFTPAEGKTAIRTLEQGLEGKTISPELRKAAQNVLSRIVQQGGNINATQLRRALLDSGLFLEARLAAGDSIQPATDLKANLFRLLFFLRAQLGQTQFHQDSPLSTQGRDTPASTAESGLQRLLVELLRLTEGSLARVQAHQLSSLSTEENPGQIWQFELPIQKPDRVDSFLIRLEQEQCQKGDQADSAWKVTLNFNFTPLGPVEAKLTLRGEEISSSFHAENPDSAALLERHLPKLNDAFIQAGLKVGRLHARQGTVEAPNSAPSTPLPLLDEKA